MMRVESLQGAALFNSAILDVTIGLVFVFVLVSTLCSAIREGIEGWLKTRATYLEYAVRELLHDRGGQGLARSFFEHPLIHGLYQGDYAPGAARAKPSAWQRGRNMPSYIPSRSFAAALIDLAARGPATDAAAAAPNANDELSIELLRSGVAQLQPLALRRAALAAIDGAQGDLERVRANLETWYDGAMDRVSGWYKRTTQWFIFAIALGVAAGLNINAITIADSLYRDQLLRATVTSAAEGTQELISYQAASVQLEALRLPIGWSRGWGAPRSIAQKSNPEVFELWNDAIAPLLGLLITAFAAMLGAPFWFDVLNKVMVIRATVKPREKSQEEGSEDRPPTRRGAPTSPGKS